MENFLMAGYVVGVEVPSRSNKKVFTAGVNSNRTTWLCPAGQRTLNGVKILRILI